MYNYRIKRLNVWSVCKIVTLIGMIFGTCGGLLLGIVERDLFGMLMGLFVGCVFGLITGITSVIYTVLFNFLASSIGGIELHLERKDAFLDSLEQPIPLVNASEPSSPETDE
jgi:hypothetical protein